MTLLYPQGLSILLGRVSPPPPLDFAAAFPPEAFDGMGIRSGRRPCEERIVEAASWADGVIAQAGGWGHITRSCRDWKRMHPGDWDMIADHVRAVRPRRRWLGESALRVIARAYGVDVHTVIRKRRAFPGVLAEFILYGEIENSVHANDHTNDHAMN
jgi:hypothetical protein